MDRIVGVAVTHDRGPVSVHRVSNRDNDCGKAQRAAVLIILDQMKSLQGRVIRADFVYASEAGSRA